MLKKCSKCGIEKTEDNYSSKNNIKSACIDCNKLAVADLNKKYREKNKENYNKVMIEQKKLEIEKLQNELDK